MEQVIKAFAVNQLGPVELAISEKARVVGWGLNAWNPDSLPTPVLWISEEVGAEIVGRTFIAVEALAEMHTLEKYRYVGTASGHRCDDGVCQSFMAYHIYEILGGEGRS